MLARTFRPREIYPADMGCGDPIDATATVGTPLGGTVEHSNDAVPADVTACPSASFALSALDGKVARCRASEKQSLGPVSRSANGPFAASGLPSHRVRRLRRPDSFPCASSSSSVGFGIFSITLRTRSM